MDFSMALLRRLVFHFKSSRVLGKHLVLANKTFLILSFKEVKTGVQVLAIHFSIDLTVNSKSNLMSQSREIALKSNTKAHYHILKVNSVKGHFRARTNSRLPSHNISKINPFISAIKEVEQPMIEKKSLQT